MGNAVNAGSDNDELTDNLRDAEYIRTPQIERVFRAVDRGEYILPEQRQNAYRDQAWRSNHLHLSAPCIYSEVMEGLSLAPGMSFLNLGSGTGYLSTVAGLLLGHAGINHGVEFYEDVVEYANQKLADFKLHSGAIDEFDFCEPTFMQANCLCLASDRRYDRVYVGAGCPPEFCTYMKSMLKDGGVLVMPFHDQLLQVRRESESVWQSSSLLPVNFATLILPKEECKQMSDLIEIHPESLQKLCRAKIRNILRDNIELEVPELLHRAEFRNKSPTHRRAARRPISDDEDDFPERLPHVTYASFPPPMDNNRSLDDLPRYRGTNNTNNNNNRIIASANTISAELTEALSSLPGVSVCSVTMPERVAPPERRKFDSGLGDEDSNDEEPEDNGQTQKRSKLGWFNRLIKKSPETPPASANSTSAQAPLDAPAHEVMEYEVPLDRLLLREDEMDSSFEVTNEIDDEDDEDDDDDNEEEEEDLVDILTNATPSVLSQYFKRRTVESPYTALMHSRIEQLPLPPALKIYVNCCRQ